MKRAGIKKTGSRTVIFSLLFAVVAFQSLAADKQQMEIVYAQGMWQEAQLQSVFNHLSQISGVDFVLDPGVTGTITLSVTKKSWREILDIVCKMKQLTTIDEPNYIYVMLMKDYMAQEQNKETGMRVMDDIKTLDREIVKLNNVPADEMQNVVKDLLSKRGKIIIAKHTNSLIIYDLTENIQVIKKVIGTMDVEVEQVSISAKIVEIGGNAMNNIGIQWSLFDNKLAHLPLGSGVSGPLEKATFSILSPQRFNIAMDYLFTKAKSNILAQPQITTLDNKEARIFMGSQVPITYKDVANNTLVKMIDAGTELIVTPHITAEGKIVMDLKPTKRSFQINDNLPIINEQSAQTNVIVNNGETVVIAGLTLDDKQDAEGGIPFLKDLPIVGYLFKKAQKQEQKRELAIFVTPTVIKKTASVSFADSLGKPNN